MKIGSYLFFLFGLLFVFVGKISAQGSASNSKPEKEIEAKAAISDKDVFDLIRATKTYQKYFSNKPPKEFSKPQFAIAPAAGYTLQTGFALLLAGNLSFFTDQSDLSKLSFVSTSIAFTEKAQVILPLYASIWTKGNRFNIVSDNRFMKYPSQTWGVGPRAIDADASTIVFNYLKLHESILFKIARNTYAGAGFYYDNFYNISETNLPLDKPSKLSRYGKQNKEVSSGPVLRFLYDSRPNQVNAWKGNFASLTYRANAKMLGSQSNWNSILVDLRKYIPFPGGSKNTLAFWNYYWLCTNNGRPPYLMLPSTGWDDFFNIGRGYIQGRFKGKNMAYLEAEYRFRLTQNGLLGGVVFGNVQSFSRDLSSNYNLLIPGYGLGLRVKLNKHSATNLCVDYGFGINGSRGFFVNLGEVF